MGRKRRKARTAPISQEEYNRIEQGKRLAKIVDDMVGRAKRRGLPLSVDAADLRQEGLIRAHGVLQRAPEAPNGLIARCVQNRIVDIIRGRLAERPSGHNIAPIDRKYYTGMSRIVGWRSDESGNSSWFEEPVWSDPFFILSVDALESRHCAWERDRSSWPADVDLRAKRWRRALMNSPVGQPPRSAA